MDAPKANKRRRVGKVFVRPKAVIRQKLSSKGLAFLKKIPKFRPLEVSSFLIKPIP
jgi:hypothetical protein